MKKSEPHYVTPIFIIGEKLTACTINVYRDATHQTGAYTKSRFASDAMARMEPVKPWGNLLYRIKVRPK